MRRRFFLSVLLAPALGAVLLFIDYLQTGQFALETIANRIQATMILLAFTLRAIRWGRYPTVVEMMRTASPFEYLISVLLCWLTGAIAIFLIWNGVHYVVKRLPPRPVRLIGIATGVGVLIALAIPIVGLLISDSQPGPAHIVIRFDRTLGKMPDYAHGFSQGGESEMRTVDYFVSALKILEPLEPHFIRLDHLYDYYDVFHQGKDGRPVYDWRELDRLIDAILASGAEPLMCLSYLPPALTTGSVYGPPTNLTVWEELVYQTVYHFNVERQLNIRYWEVWNEPNIPSFWNGTLDEYLQLYEATAKGALRADPTILLGGPATASPERWLGMSMPYFERNWITELARYTQAHNLPLNFVSWHYYDARSDNYAWNTQVHQRWLAGLSQQPLLLLTEWNWSSAPAPEMDSEITAAYAAAVFTTLADTPIRQTFFFEPIDSSTQWEGRWGMIRKDGVIKPVYNTFQLASNLKGDRLTVSSDHSDVGALASRENNQIHLLAWHYGQSSLSRLTTFTLNGLPTNVVLTATLYGVDTEHGNLYRGRQAGSLLSENVLPSVVVPGQWELSIELPMNSVRLIELTIKHTE